MYCTFCGYENSAGHKFCEACGKPLAVKPAGSVHVRTSSFSRKTFDWAEWLRRLPSLGAVFVIWGFFLPWVLVSCSISLDTMSPGLTASGYEIASGNFVALQEIRDYGAMLGSPEELASQEASSPLLWLILILGLVGLFTLTGRVSGSVVAILVGILGVAGMTIVTMRLSEIGRELSMQGLKLEYQKGFWMTWIGFLWLALFAIMTVRQKR